MVKRIISAIVMIIVCVPAFFVGGYYLMALEAAMILISAIEINKLIGSKFKLYQKILFFIFYLASFGLIYLDVKYSIYTILLYVLIFFIISIIDENFSLDYLSFSSLMLVILISYLYGLTVINKNKQLMLIVLVGTYLTDAAALFVGKAFGKRKLNTRISPNKTVEGFMGAYNITTAVCLAIAFASHMTDLKTFLICFLSPVIGQCGDLAFSEIKRHFQIKDFGNLIPGHGGVLDRIDSLTFNVILTIIILGIF